MSADLLRRAADALRKSPGLVDTAPWTAETTNAGSAWINTQGLRHAWGMHGSIAAAEYVALMHPPVAHALANWLEAFDEVWDGSEDPDVWADVPFALALARAVLREAADVAP